GGVLGAVVDSVAAAHDARPSVRPLRVQEERDSGRRVHGSGVDVPLRDGSRNLGPRRRLQGARARQPLRRRHERLPEHRGGQPGFDGDGELAAGGRPSARAAGSCRGRTGGGRGVSELGVAGAERSGQVEIACGEQRVGVVTLGGGLRSYEVAGRELVDGFAPAARPTSGRGQVLAPWPNRIENGSYEFDGKRLQLPLTEPEHGNAIHGLVRKAAWNIVDQAPDRVVLDYVVEPQPGYPFTLALGIEYALSDTGLAVTTTARNIGREACPYGSGQHPYLTLGTPTIGGLRLRVPAHTVLISDERGLPVGSEPVERTECDFRAARPIGGT